MIKKIKRKYSIYKNCIYALIIIVIVWQVTLLFLGIKNRIPSEAYKTINVTVRGIVKNPGYYEVPLGTTNFEILKVAGILPTSNITSINLAAQLQSNQLINVDSLKTPAGAKANIRLEVFTGAVSIISSAGIDRMSQEGMTIDEGDRVLTEDNSQAELSYNTYSKIDIDNFSEITFDTMQIDSSGNNVVVTNQKAGISWYTISYTQKSEKFKTITSMANITVAGKGAEYTIEVKYSEVIINVLNGLLLIERLNSNDAINLISGQSVTIYKDNRPFQITKTSKTSNITSQFNKLTKAKTDILLQHTPLNVLFCSTPNIIYLLNIQFSNSKINVVRLPSETSVSVYVHGFSTLQEALL